MAIIFDAISESSDSTVSPMTWSHIVGVGNKYRNIIVGNGQSRSEGAT